MADVGQAMARLDRMAKKVPLDAPWNAPKAKQWDSQTVWSWMRHNMATPDRPRDDGDRGEGRLGRDARGRVAAAPPLLHRVGGQLRPAARHRRRRAAGPLRRGRGHARHARRGRPRRPGGAGRTGAPDRVVGGRRAADGRRHKRPCAARDRRGPGHAGRAHRVRPAAAGLPRPAHAARADGRGDQVLRGLRRAVLARGGNERQHRQRLGPAQPDGRQLSTVGRAGHPRRLPRGRPRAVVRPRARARAPRRGARQPRPAAGPARWAAGGLHREELGRGGMEPRLLRGLHAARGADRVRAGAARADRADPLGRHRDRDQVERLHRRRPPVRRARRARGAAQEDSGRRAPAAVS